MRKLYTERLVRRGDISIEQAEEFLQDFESRLEDAFGETKQAAPPEPPKAIRPEESTGLPERVETGVDRDRLDRIAKVQFDVPDGFTRHPKLDRIFKKARERYESGSIDWAMGETLAFGSLLLEGIPIRISGQDTERGTFSHRHLVLHDAQTGKQLVPLAHIAEARLEVYNSLLTETAAMGFEYGYSVGADTDVVIWEAQFGDFANVAQPIIDQFLSSGRMKWAQYSRLILLLPHGYEGQGPDHSSARPERILQAAADVNLRLVNCSTAAQYFHLLRRQASLLRTDPLPLFVLTPKSLLRHPAVVSMPRELAEGRFQPVIDDPEARARANGIRRLVLCSGKVFVDVNVSEKRATAVDVAVCRVEQLYPFPIEPLRAVISTYPRLRDVVWLQEEPENMGAWEFARPLLEEMIGDRCPLRYIGRARSASPSEGSAAWHQLNQKVLIEQAFDLDVAAPDPSMVLSKEVRSLAGSKR